MENSDNEITKETKYCCVINVLFYLFAIRGGGEELKRGTTALDNMRIQLC